MFDSVTGSKGVREKLPSGTISNTQWRRAGVKYSNNECFVDIEESLDFIIDKNGSIVFSEVRGVINCRTKLSGMPDLMLSFVNPRVLDDPSFHPCVRLTEWTNSRVLSFIPPDGFFVLANYIIGPETPLAIPLNVRPTIKFDEGQCPTPPHPHAHARAHPFPSISCLFGLVWLPRLIESFIPPIREGQKLSISAISAPSISLGRAPLSNAI